MKATNDDKFLSRWASPKGLLPSTLLNHNLCLECLGGAGLMSESSGTLLDCCPAGAILTIGTVPSVTGSRPNTREWG